MKGADKSGFRTRQHLYLLILLAVLALLAGAACGVLMWFDPPRDGIAADRCPPAFFCETSENRIDVQTDGNCAAYAAAYVLRSMGVQADGEEIAGEMKRRFGFVPADSIVRVLERYGIPAAAYHGSVDTLKQRLTDGVPVIVFADASGDTHYTVLVGYDEAYFYLADSLAQYAGTGESGYNRKLTAEEFQSILATDTSLSDNIYIVAG